MPKIIHYMFDMYFSDRSHISDFDKNTIYFYCNCRNKSEVRDSFLRDFALVKEFKGLEWDKIDKRTKQVVYFADPEHFKSPTYLLCCWCHSLIISAEEIDLLRNIFILSGIKGVCCWLQDEEHSYDRQFIYHHWP